MLPLCRKLFRCGCVYRGPERREKPDPLIYGPHRCRAGRRRGRNVRACARACACVRAYMECVCVRACVIAIYVVCRSFPRDARCDARGAAARCLALGAEFFAFPEQTTDMAVADDCSLPLATFRLPCVSSRRFPLLVSKAAELSSAFYCLHLHSVLSGLLLGAALSLLVLCTLYTGAGDAGRWQLMARHNSERVSEKARGAGGRFL